MLEFIAKHNSGASASDIGKIISTTKQNRYRYTELLIEKGLVRKTGTGRATLFYITESGRETLTRAPKKSLPNSAKSPLRISILSKKDYPEIEKLRRSFEVSKHPQICIAVGGDGTFIRAVKQNAVPILPIRSNEPSSIGYHSDVSLSDMDWIIASLRRGDYTVDPISNFLEVECGGKKSEAINEIRINNINEEVSVSVYEHTGHGKRKIYPYVISGDGLLITGMIGSTAYNRSAGGPIITTPNAICLTFINPDGPYNSPIVFDSASVIEVRIEKYACVLRCDSDQTARLKEGNSFKIRLSKRMINVVKLDGKQESLADKFERLYTSKMLEP
jgi:NAD+ kinase